MKVQVPEGVDLFTFLAAALAALEAVLRRRRAGATGRTSPGTFEQAPGFHETPHRSIRGLGVGLGCLFGQHEQVVGVICGSPHITPNVASLIMWRKHRIPPVLLGFGRVYAT